MASSDQFHKAHSEFGLLSTDIMRLSKENRKDKIKSERNPSMLIGNIKTSS